MRYIFGFLALLMLLAVLVQYNDPDGPLWMAYYGVPALWAIIAALRPSLLKRRIVSPLLTLSLISGIALTIWHWPSAAGWWQKEVWWESEESREGMGMMIATLVLLAVFATSSSRRYRWDFLNRG